MRAKQLLVAAGFSCVSLCSYAFPGFSNEVLTLPTLSAQTFFDTDTGNVEKNRIVNMVYHNSISPDDLDDLVKHGISRDVIQGLKLKKLVEKLPAKQRAEFQQLFEETQQARKAETLSQRWKILAYFGFIVVIFGACCLAIRKEGNS